MDVMVSGATHGLSAMRDARPLNSMSDAIKQAHGFLILWGEWSRDAGVRAWPARTLLGRVIDEGPHGALSTSHPPIADPPADVARVETIVKGLGQIDQKVLRIEYVQAWALRIVKARAAHMRVKQYECALRRARERVHLGLL